MKYLIPCLFLFFLLGVIGVFGDIDRKEEMLFNIIGKLESDADYCLTDYDIKLVNESELVDDYKSYLLEIDTDNKRSGAKCLNLN